MVYRLTRFLGAVLLLAAASLPATAQRVGPLQSQSNLGDLSNAAAARTNLGLGAVATTAPGSSLVINAGILDLSSAVAAPGTLSVASTATGSVTVTGGAVFGADDYRRLRIFPTNTGGAGSGDSQILTLNRVTSKTTDTSVLRSTWVQTHSGVNAGVQANAWISTTSNAGANPGETWGLLSTFHTNASDANGANHVGGYFQAVRDSIPASSVGIDMLAGVVEARSLTGQASSVDGRMRGLEVDLFAGGPDDLAGGKVGREAIIIVLGKGKVGDASPTFSTLLGVYPNVGDGVTVKNGIAFNNSLTWTGGLFDTRNAVESINANAIWLKTGHHIGLDGDGVGTPAATRISSDGTTIALTGAASVSGALGVTGTGTFTGSLIGGNGGAAAVTISSGSIAVPPAQSLNLSTGGAGQSIGLGNNGGGFGQVLLATTNTGGNAGDGATGNLLTVPNRLTAQFYRSTGATYTLSGPTINQLPLSLSANYTGTTTATDPNVYRLAVPSDTANATNAANAFTTLNIARNFGGAGTSGSRGGLRVQLTQTGGAYTDAGNPSFMGIEPWLTFNASIGGTGQGLLAKGLAYGSNPQILLQPGARKFRLVNAVGEANWAVFASNQRLTLGGTVTAGDVLNLTFTSAGIVGSPVTVSWTTGASQTLGMVANNIEAGINSNAALRAAGVSAKVKNGNLELYWIETLTLTMSVSQTGSGSTTMTLGAVTLGASSDVKLGASLISLTDDSSPALGDSAYLLMSSQGIRAPGGQMDKGIWFGGLPNYAGAWGIAPQGTLIGAGLTAGLDNTGKSGYLPPSLAKFGVDFQRVAFDPAGAAWRSSGAIIGPDGAIFVGGHSIVSDSTGLKLDASQGARASAIALASGGGGGAGSTTNNYFVGEKAFVLDGIVRVTGVNPSTGAVTTFAVESMPSYQAGSAPTNPVAVEGGSGTGWTVNITWPTPANNVVAVQPNGGATTFGGNVRVLVGALTVGSASLTMSAGGLGMTRIAASGSAPGAAGGKIEMVCGTNAGSAKFIAYAGTSATPVTIADNVGAGVTGC